MHRININRDLAQWLYDRVQEGTPEKQVSLSLTENGYDPSHVKSLCKYAFRQTDQLKEALLVYDRDAENDTGVSAPDFIPVAAIPDTHEHTIDGDIHILMRCERPHVVLFGNFLSHDECDALVALGSEELTRAAVISRETGEPMIDHRRTSDYAMFQRGQEELLVKVEERIARITGVPVDHGEGLQIMRYGEGAEYQPHFDFFDMDGAFMRRSRDSGGQRMATMVIYLNDAPAGGETTFPDAGLSFSPRKGNAVYFAYTAEDNSGDNLSFHGGAPVLRGEKWIASKWLRRNPYFLDIK